MTYSKIKKEVARNLGLLASDETTITDSRVTEEGIKDKINELYREEVMQELIDNYPTDFEHVTAPRNTYTANPTVVSVSGTTLTCPTGTFSNSDVGLKIQNTTYSETIKVASYTSSAVVELESEPQNVWDGTPIYILGNEYTFQGEIDDLKEIISVDLKYASTDTRYTRAELRRINSFAGVDVYDFSKTSPVFYLTNIQKNGENVRGVGILPAPDNYDGKIQIRYTAQFPELVEDSDTPAISNAGFSRTLIQGVTAWGFRLMGDNQNASEYENLYRESLARLMMNYRPRSRSGSSRVRLGNHYRYIGSYRQTGRITR